MDDDNREKYAIYNKKGEKEQNNVCTALDTIEDKRVQSYKRIKLKFDKGWRGQGWFAKLFNTLEI